MVAHHQFRFATRNCDPVEPHVPAVLRVEVDKSAVRRPARGVLPIVDRARQFTPVCSICVDQPDMRVFHGGLKIGEAALGGLVDERLAVPRPAGTVFRVFGRGQAADGSGSDIESENVVIEELIFVWLAVRNEGDLFAVGRPVDGVLVVIAGR